MKTLTRYTLLSYIGPFFLTLFISLFVLFMQFLWKWLEDFVGKGLDLGTIAELVFYVSLTLIPMALPLAILLSSLMTFGNMGEHYELVALKSSGLSLQKIMRPLMIFSLFLSGVAFVFSNHFLPFANLKMWTLVNGIAETKPAFNIKEGAFYNGINGYVFRVEKKESDGQTLSGIIIYDHTQGYGNTRVTTAGSGKMEISDNKQFLIIHLENGYSYDEVINEKTPVSHPLVRTHFKTQTLKINLQGFEVKKMDEELFKSNYEMLTLNQIEGELDSISDSHTEARRVFINKFREKHLTNHQHKETPKPVPSLENIPLPGKQAFLSKIIQDSLVKKAGNNNLAFTSPPDNIPFLVYENALSIAREAKQDLTEYMDELTYLNKPKILLKIVWHKKFTLSFACLVLFFIGAPLGAIIRKGGLGMPVVISILLFILYYVLSITGEKFAKEGIISPMLGSWISSLILLPLGIFLTWKATTDSSLLDMDYYSGKIKRI